MTAVRRRNSPERRGVALLLVLATLALVLTGAAALAALSATTKHVRGVDRDARVADDLIHAADAPIVAWLASKASRLALPPDAPVPARTILDEAWEVDEGHGGDSPRVTPVGMVIVAFDQCGMIPWRAAAEGSTLRLSLPERVASAIDRIDLRADDVLGLDLAARAGIAPVFPDASSLVPGRPTPLGALVATHGSSTARINVNTAPRALLEHAHRAAGRGGLESVLASRAAGRPAAGPAPPPDSLPRAGGGPSGGKASASRVELVASSDAWAFRIDIRVGDVRRSWWSVHELRSNQWRCVQRLAIPD